MGGDEAVELAQESGVEAVRAASRLEPPPIAMNVTPILPSAAWLLPL